MENFFLEELSIFNFRNLINQQINFGNKINCIYGKNAIGKTNILEAIYFLLNKKSFRKNASFEQVLNIGGEKPQIYISGKYSSHGEFLKTLALFWDHTVTRWTLDGKAVSRNHLGATTVFIGPQDCYNFFSYPDDRKDWFDEHFCFIDIEYKKLLSAYQKIIKQKNYCYRENPPNKQDILVSYNETLAPIIFKILRKREHFVYELNKHLSQIFYLLFNEKLELKLFYEGSLANLTLNEIEKKLQNEMEKEIKISHCVVGVHRDDYVITVNELNIRDYGSMGQQKAAFLALVFAYIELFRYKFSFYPLVLLDDISTEFDEARYCRLLDYMTVRQFQVVLSTASKTFKDFLKQGTKVKIFEVLNGKVVELNQDNVLSFEGQK